MGDVGVSLFDTYKIDVSIAVLLILRACVANGTGMERTLSYRWALIVSSENIRKRQQRQVRWERSS